jgi:hypothetical protein
MRLLSGFESLIKGPTSSLALCVSFTYNTRWQRYPSYFEWLLASLHRAFSSLLMHVRQQSRQQCSCEVVKKPRQGWWVFLVFGDPLVISDEPCYTLVKRFIGGGKRCQQPRFFHWRRDSKSHRQRYTRRGARACDLASSDIIVSTLFDPSSAVHSYYRRHPLDLPCVRRSISSPFLLLERSK